LRIENSNRIKKLTNIRVEGNVLTRQVNYYELCEKDYKIAPSIVNGKKPTQIVKLRVFQESFTGYHGT